MGRENSMRALIGSTGFVGGILAEQIQFDKLYNSKNINDIVNYEFDEVYCAAPTGSRLFANQNPEEDVVNVANLIKTLQTINTKHFVLIGTVDAINCVNTAYGQHRKMFEDAVKDIFDSYTIVRLPSLIHPKIQKNILHDLKNSVYLDKINLAQNNQWYPLHRLSTDINNMTENEANFVSVPILNEEIVNWIAPGVGKYDDAKLYDLRYNNDYLINKEEICKEIKDYLL